MTRDCEYDFLTQPHVANKSQVSITIKMLGGKEQEAPLLPDCRAPQTGLPCLCTMIDYNSLNLEL